MREGRKIKQIVKKSYLLSFRKETLNKEKCSMLNIVVCADHPDVDVFGIWLVDIWSTDNELQILLTRKGFAAFDLQ